MRKKLSEDMRLDISEKALLSALAEVRRKKDEFHDSEVARAEEHLKASEWDISKIPSEVLSLHRTLRHETDRGCGLVGVASLDAALSKLISAHMLNDAKVKREVFEVVGVLATLRAKTEIAYLLGYVGSDTRRELGLLRRIRNEFAHSAEPLTFAEEKIAARCRELRFGLWNQVEHCGRRRFVRSAMTTLGVIHRATRRATVPVREDDFPGTTGADLLARAEGYLHKL